MLRRWTLWETEDGDPVQLALAVLDDTWEPLMERTLPCGPFHSAEERRLELLDDQRRWMAQHGIQMELGSF